MDRRLALGLAAFVGLSGCSRGSDGGGAGPSPSAASLAAVPDPPAVDPVKQALIAMDAMPATAAFEFQRSLMTDTVNEDSPGALVFASWAARRMRWSEVHVAQDETTPALVKKDSDAARGKRICATGQVVQIQVAKLTTGGHLSSGLLLSDSGNIYRYFAAGSSGTLVENSYTHFCGIVTGTYDYSNSMGGTGHAVTVVGMFDLPENRAAGR